jgi:hypothetical protein
MHLCRNACILERGKVNQRVLYVVDRIVFSLHQERRRCLAGHWYVRIQSALLRLTHDELLFAELRVPLRGGDRQMAGIKKHSKIGTAALLVRVVYRRVQPFLKMRAERRDQTTARRKPDHSDFVRIDVPLRGAKPDESKRPLRILQGNR